MLKKYDSIKFKKIYIFLIYTSNNTLNRKTQNIKANPLYKIQRGREVNACKFI
jgi:hypothetical protein